MKKLFLILIVYFIMVMASCDAIITKPAPFIGSYIVRERPGSQGYIYSFSLRDNGEFTFIQCGGASTSETIVFTGKYDYTLSSFDFYNSTGTIIFMPEEPKDSSFESLIFTVGMENSYSFEWELPLTTVNSQLVLISNNKAVGLDITTSQTGAAELISSAEFQTILDNALKTEDDDSDSVDDGNADQQPSPDDDNPSIENPEDTPQQPPVEDEEEQPDSDGNESGEEEVVPPEEGTTEEEEKI